MVLSGVYLAHVALEDSGCIVHGTSLQARKGQHGCMGCLVAGKRFILSAACRLVAYEVRIGAAESGGAHSLVGIDHDMVFSCFGDAVQVVVVHPLSVVVFTTWYDIAHISALHRVVAVFVHKVVGCIEVAFVVAHRRRCLMVHHQTYTLGMSIVVESLDVEVGIWCLEIEDVVLTVSEPVFPTYVPTLYENL